MNVFQALSDARINPFGMQLLAESLLKSPIAEQLHAGGKPLRFFFPVGRGDCAGWAGVDVTLKPAKVGDVVDAELPTAPAAAPAPADRWLIVRESVLDIGLGDDVRTGGRPELGYAVIANTATYATEDEARQALKACNLPVGWVLMPLSRFLPDLAASAQTVAPPFDFHGHQGERPGEPAVSIKVSTPDGAELASWQRDAQGRLVDSEGGDPA